MSELFLPRCPICNAKDSLFRKTIERGGQPFIWYECAKCGSLLLWLGNDQWAYQKVGRDELSHLLSHPLTENELLDLLPKAEVEMPKMPDLARESEQPHPQGKKSGTKRLLPWLLGICLVGFLLIVGLGALEATGNISLFSTAPLSPTSVAAFRVNDPVVLTGAGHSITLWKVTGSCELDQTVASLSEGQRAVILRDPCYFSRQHDYLYLVNVAGKEGWVREGDLMPASEYTPVPTQTPRPTSTPDLRSPFEKCVQSGQGVRYVISGSGVEAVSLTWENDTGGTNQGDYKVPYCKTFTGFGHGDFLYISAQIVAPTSGAGSITCRIYDGTSIVAEASAHGFASIATCNGTAR